MTKASTSRFIALATLCGTMATAALADGHEKSPEAKAVDARHAQMQVIGYSIGILGATAKGEMDFNSDMVDSAAQNIATMASLNRASLWIEGTEQGTVDDTRAKAEIWSDPEGFNAGFEKLKAAASAIVGASDAAAVGAGMGDLGGACKACHEKYRGPEN